MHNVVPCAAMRLNIGPNIFFRGFRHCALSAEHLIHRKLRYSSFTNVSRIPNVLIQCVCCKHEWMHGMQSLDTMILLFSLPINLMRITQQAWLIVLIYHQCHLLITFMLNYTPKLKDRSQLQSTDCNGLKLLIRLHVCTFLLGPR